MKNRNKLEDKLDEIERLYVRKKLTMLEIAERFEVSEAAIWYRLKKMGVCRRNQGIQPKKVKRESIVNLHIFKGMAIKNVASRLRVSSATIQDRVTKFGISVRSSESVKKKYPELYNLQIEDSVLIPKPAHKRPHRAIYLEAQKINIRISVKSMNEDTFRVTRLA